MILTALAALSLALATLYAGMTAVNLAALRPPRAPGRGEDPPAVSLLVPARDEAANIDPLLDAALATEGVPLEVIVLDDNSTDDTARLVMARDDPRVRLVDGKPLPPGWVGKQHACWQLAQSARHPILVFLDADVRLAPDALARLVADMQARRLDLLSGFPRQATLSLSERLVIPQILAFLYGYLPIPMARRAAADPRFAVACGQMIAVRRETYFAAGGHQAIRASLHDGLDLPRRVRAAGGRTDLCDATALATCRMYDGWRTVWAGFSKNARAGMARPAALPVWTLLLGGGHVLPFLLAPAAFAQDEPFALNLALAAILLVWTARAALALRVRQTPLSVLLHPVGVAIMLAIQWRALLGGRRRPAIWRGRAYDA